MIHNSFRRIALAQGLLPVRNYISEVPNPDSQPNMPKDLATLVAYAAETAREPKDSVTQV